MGCVNSGIQGHNISINPSSEQVNREFNRFISNFGLKSF